MSELLTVRLTEDFELGGDGRRWACAKPCPLVGVGGSARYRTEVRLLWSHTGLYVRFDCQDARLSCSGLGDFADLYEEDVVELFLQPRSQSPLYFEYELSPLGAELPLLVSSCGGAYYGWLPFQYREGRVTRRHTQILGGEKEPHAPCAGWTAEVFLPFALLEGVPCTPPTAGDRWRANFFRIDYDDPERPSRWAWDRATGTEFHDFGNYGEIVFDDSEEAEAPSKI